jgi:hypothetical protein
MFHLTFTGPFAGKPLCHGTIFDKPCLFLGVYLLETADR